MDLGYSGLQSLRLRCVAIGAIRCCAGVDMSSLVRASRVVGLCRVASVAYSTARGIGTGAQRRSLSYRHRQCASVSVDPVKSSF